MHTILHDLRFALRHLRHSTGFTCTVVLTLALGVGANATVFSVLNALILRPLPLPDAKHLVFFNRVGPTTGSFSSSPSQSYPDYRDLRDQNRSFSSIAAYRMRPGGIGTAGAMKRSWFYEASENYFDVLGLQPALGRFFHASDAHGPDSMPYIVLSYNYWQREFASNRNIIGKVVDVNNHPYTVVGVAPQGFGGTELFVAADFWAPLIDQKQIDGYSDLESRGDHNAWMIGRLRPRVSTQQAEADINTVSTRMAAQYTEDEALAFQLSRPGLIGDTFGKPVRAFLFGVLALAGLVLLAACANLGSLFAARTADRAREFAVRLALGARRSSLVRQLLSEAVLVSFLGGAAGLALANVLLRALTLWRPSSDFPVQVMVNADWRVSLLAMVLSLASGIFFGLVPARQIWRSDAYLLIKSGSTAVVGSRRWALRDLLLVVQIVLCSVLVTASLVAARGLARSLHTSYGFQPQGAILATFDLRMIGYDEAKATAFQHRAIDVVAALPGVTAAGFADITPLSLSNSDSNVYPDGTTDFRESNAIADAGYYSISPGYLGAAQTRLQAGRDFNWRDIEHAPDVAIVNQAFAHKVFGSAGAMGRYFVRSGRRRQVVGIVEDGKYVSLTEDPRPVMFFPAAQQPNTQAVLVIRSHNTEAGSAAAIHDALKTLDPNLPVAIQSWPEAMGTALFPSVAATVALGIMGGLAAMLAITGIFGMASYSVSRRMRELGLRIALGAQRVQVLRPALGRPAQLLVIGSTIGLFLGAMTSRLLAHVVYQASPHDPVVLAGVVASMAIIALLASWLPARRALRADPATLLREE